MPVPDTQARSATELEGDIARLRNENRQQHAQPIATTRSAADLEAEVTRLRLENKQLKSNTSISGTPASGASSSQAGQQGQQQQSGVLLDRPPAYDFV